MISGPGTRFRAMEKMAYLIGIPFVFAAGGYTIYNRNVLQADERAEKMRKTEERFLTKNPDNMIKL